jgi:RNA polymerase sigma-70 factor (ECF subfamily)
MDRSVTSGTGSTARSELVEQLPTHSAELLATARFLVRGEAEAYDLVQTTLELAIRHVDQVRDPARLRPWLIAIETREAMRLRRRIARAFGVPMARPPVADARPVDTMLALRDAVEALPSRMRAAVVLHHMVGLTVDETARAMSVSPNTVRAHLKTGLRRLRENLK